MHSKRCLLKLSCGISFPGQYIDDLVKALPGVKADVKALISGGMTAVGALDVKIDLDMKGRIKMSLTAIFKVFEDAAKGYEEVTTLFLGATLPKEVENKYGDTAALLGDFK